MRFIPLLYSLSIEKNLEFYSVFSDEGVKNNLAKAGKP